MLHSMREKEKKRDNPWSRTVRSKLLPDAPDVGIWSKSSVHLPLFE
jgi:hypothetical protein